MQLQYFPLPLPALRLSPTLLVTAPLLPSSAPSLCRRYYFCSSTGKSFEAQLRSLFLQKAFPISFGPRSRWQFSSQSAPCSGHLWGTCLPGWLGAYFTSFCSVACPGPGTGQQGVWSADLELVLSGRGAHRPGKVNTRHGDLVEGACRVGQGLDCSGKTSGRKRTSVESRRFPETEIGEEDSQGK